MPPEEEGNLEAGSGAQTQQDAGTVDADQTNDAQTGDNQTADAGEKTGAIDYRTEFEKLQQQQKELQSQFTSVSQKAAQSEQMLEALRPYIDYARMPGQQQGGQPAAGQGEAGAEGEDEETYLNAKQVKELLSHTAQEVRNEIIAQRVRTQYPDVCDGDWKETLVKNELMKVAKTHPYEDAEARIKRAVESARGIIKSVQDEGRKQAEAERKQAEAAAEAKKKAATAASGLQATGVTSPSTGSAPQEMGGQSYVDQKRSRREATRNIAP